MRESKMASIADGFPFKNTSEVEGGWGGEVESHQLCHLRTAGA